MARVTDLLDEFSAQMDPSRPWDLPGARELDQVTFLRWLERNCDEPEPRDNIAMFIAQAPEIERARHAEEIWRSCVTPGMGCTMPGMGMAEDRRAGRTGP